MSINVFLSEKLPENKDKIISTISFNKKVTPDKIEIKKFDPVVRKHVLYKEAKIK